MTTSTTSDIVAILESYASGELPTETTVAALSDLDREGARAVAERWASIAAELRAGILALAVDLAERRIELNFQRLAYVAIEDPVPGVREAAFYALDDIGGHETARRIAAALEKETSPSVVVAAAAAAKPYVLQHALGELHEATGERLVAALRSQAAREDMPPEALGEVVEALAPHDAYWVDELIRDAYYSDERALQQSAIVAMGRTANEDWLEYLEDELQVDDSEKRRQAAEACGEIASEDAIEMLTPLLDDENTEVVAAAIAAFGEIGGEIAVQRLEEFQERVPAELAEPLEDATEAARGEIRTFDGIGDSD